jgi:protein ImuB
MMHWLAIHLPDLPLEVFERALAVPLPLAVSEAGRVERILRANPAAIAEGVRPGLGITAARSLCRSLRVLPRCPAAEREALERLGARGLGFTPHVSLSPPDALLLDVAASLRLFGGAETLMRQVSEGMSGLGYRHRLVLAPTPLGALVLARCMRDDAPERTSLVADLRALRSALAPLPLPALGLEDRELDDLTRMGLSRISDLLRLPRAGLAERLGQARLTLLDRLLGEAADPRPWFKPPPRYRGRLELPAEVERVEGLIFPCRRLLDELEGVLRGHQGGTDRLDWRLQHAGREATCFVLGAARPLREAGRWLELLRERLGRLELPAPVREIRLLVSRIYPLDPEEQGLFPEPSRAAQVPDPALLDRLRARLGPAAVRGIALVADHRPEYSWRSCHPGETGAGIPRADRPVWLLSQPRPLQSRQGRPWLDGPLDLGQERERIDIGWWDDREVRRDYFVAVGRHGERLWIYREIEGRQGWFLHGLF